MTTDFRSITEAGHTRADADQMAMAQLRHSLVAALSRQRDLLDVACGTGYALPLIAREARSVSACDGDAANVRAAAAALPSGRVFRCDAERLPLPDNSYDVVACLEALYYLQDWRGFLRASYRLLRRGGTVVISWPNPARPAFVRSPGSTVYPGVQEVIAAAAQAGFDGVCYGAFPLEDLLTARRPWLDALRRAAVRLHLIPRSLRWRMFLKRALYRRMRPLGQLTLHADPFEHLTKLIPGMKSDFAMHYFVGSKDSEVGQ